MANIMKKYDINSILEKSYVELSNTNIDQIVSDFKPIFIEFYNFIESRAYIIDGNENSNDIKTKYINILYEFMNFLKKTFYTDIDDMLVLSDHYTIIEWGPLYWGFLHYSSILLQYLNSQSNNVDLYNFPTIVFYIEYILPCNKCIGHFLEFKKTGEHKKYLKSISFGLIIYVTYVLHNIITLNIYKNDYNLNESNMPKIFSSIDFMKKYKCFPFLQTEDIKFENFIVEPLDFQSDLHINITYLLSVYLNASYLVVSRVIKSLYNKNLCKETYTYKYINKGDAVLLQKKDYEVKDLLENLINKVVTLNNEDSANVEEEHRKNVMEESINYILSKCA